MTVVKKWDLVILNIIVSSRNGSRWSIVNICTAPLYIFCTNVELMFKMFFVFTFKFYFIFLNFLVLIV